MNEESTVNSTDQMAAQIAGKDGFLAALDQSGGSAPGALREYGVPENAYQGEAEMFRLIHEMRVRIMTAPSFTGDKVIGTILFEGTMDGMVQGTPSPSYLWENRGVVPFVKVDKGLEDEADGVRLMKAMPDLDALLIRAARLGVYGTKMRSVINAASRTGIANIVQQQFAIGKQIAGHGLVPIIEPEVSIGASDKAAAEAILLEEIQARLDKVESGTKVMLKLTLPSTPDLFMPLVKHASVQRVVALSGGYPRDEACRLLALNHDVIASFSRALINDLRAQMSDDVFDASLGGAIQQIYQASVHKH